MTGYEELSPEMREQVDACVKVINGNRIIDEYAQKYLREHLSNLVATCLYIERGKPVPKGAPDA